VEERGERHVERRGITGSGTAQKDCRLLRVITGFMSCWHLVFALSGQKADIPRGILSFNPKIPAPSVFPVLLPGVVGKIETRLGQFNLTISFGRVDVQVLKVGGVACKGPVSVKAGESVVCP